MGGVFRDVINNNLIDCENDCFVCIFIFAESVLNC